MKASNLKEFIFILLVNASLKLLFVSCEEIASLLWELYSVPKLWIESEAEAATDPPCSPLPLEGTGFGDKGLHQRTHLTALMVPEGD